MKLTQLYAETSGSLSLSDQDLLFITDINGITQYSKAARIIDLKNFFQETFMLKQSPSGFGTFHTISNDLLAYNTFPILTVTSNKNLQIYNSYGGNNITIYPVETNKTIKITIDGDGNITANKFIGNCNNPTADYNLVNKIYVDNISTNINSSIKQISGILNNKINQTNNQFITSSYVDTKIDRLSSVYTTDTKVQNKIDIASGNILQIVNNDLNLIATDITTNYAKKSEVVSSINSISSLYAVKSDITNLSSVIDSKFISNTTSLNAEIQIVQDNLNTAKDQLTGQISNLATLYPTTLYLDQQDLLVSANLIAITNQINARIDKNEEDYITASAFFATRDALTGSLASKTYVDQKISELGSIFVYKNTVATINDLPTTKNKAGDVYLVSADDSEYVWIASEKKWQKLGSSKTELVDSLNNKIDQLSGIIDILSAKIKALEN